MADIKKFLTYEGLRTLFNNFSNKFADKSSTDSAISSIRADLGNKAKQADLDAHTDNTKNPHNVTLTQLGVSATATELNYVDGVTSGIQEQLNSKATSNHTHSVYANQNAFSNVTVGETTIAADSTTDTITLVAGSNVTLTPDATNDKITIAAKDTVYTHPTTSGNKHIPAGGSSGQILRWSADGTAVWGADNNTTYDAAGTNLGLVKSGGDVTISSGVITVNDDSHNHTISNVDNLQATLDAKVSDEEFATHTDNKSNPHGVSLSQLGVTATASELNVLDGITASVTELNYVDGVTSGIQGQLNAKVPTNRTINGKALSSNITLSASDVSADASGTASSAVGNHNTSISSHSDIRKLISDLSAHVDTLLDSDDTTLDQMSEVVAYIKSNKGLIDAITTSKVNVDDIVNDLTTNISDQPLSAAQGVALKALIDTLQTAVDGKAANSTVTSHTGNISNPHKVSLSQLGLTATAAEINKMDGVTATTAELNILDGVTATTAELNYVDGVTSSIQTQLNNKAAKDHSHSAYVNQNAFSNVVVGSTTISADTATDSLTIAAGDNITLTPDASNDKVTIAAKDTTYSAATTTTAGLMSAADKTKMNATNVALGACSTAAATASKVITLNGNYNWALSVGSIIVIKFSETNTAENPTFDVEGTGAKSVWYNTAVITTSNLSYAGYKDRYGEYIYDGTQYVFIGWSVDSNTTYTNAGLGHGYGTCSTAAATTAKTVSLSSYTLTKGGFVSVKFTNAVPAGATMNINSKGAKAIWYKGAAITDGVICAGEVATFIYDGTRYHMLNVDRSRFFTSLVPYGIAIPENADLNTVEYLKVGNYYCSSNATTKTLANCPAVTTAADGTKSGTAFMMTVSSPLSQTVDDESGTWKYRLRTMQLYNGPMYTQYCYSNGTAGNWIYGTWYQRVTTPVQAAVGSATKPVYINQNGYPVACNYTLGASVPSDAKFTDTTYSAATTSAAGLLSAEDKAKLDGIASEANKYSLPTASSSTLGGVKTTSTVTSTSGLTACPIISGVPYYKDTNSQYTLSSFGVTATAAELNILDGVTATATELNYVDGVTSNIQTQLNGKAASSHGTHVTYSSSAPAAAGTASAGSANNVARGDHVHPAQTTITGNAGSASKVNSSMTVKLNGGSTEGTNMFTFNGSAAKSVNITPSAIGAAESGHSHSSYANQNAFSNVTVGSTTIAADSTTDTLTLVAGSNVTITPDATNDKITIAATDTKYTHPSYTAKSSGFYKVTVDSTGHVSGTAAVAKSDITALGIPAQDTTYSAATTSAAGLMSASDKSKLDGIATGANKITVDTAMSSSSTNPVQNKVVNSAISSNISTHNSSTSAHSDIRNLITALDAKTRTITISTTDLVAGESALADGEVYLVYE